MFDVLCRRPVHEPATSSAMANNDGEQRRQSARPARYSVSNQHPGCRCSVAHQRLGVSICTHVVYPVHDVFGHDSQGAVDP